MTIKLTTVTGNATVSGDSDAVMDIVLNDLRGRCALMDGYYSEYPDDEEAETIRQSIMEDHLFFRGKSIEEINRILLEDLQWTSGPGVSPSHVITVVEE